MEHFVSIVILTMEEPKKVLECLKKQTYHNFEVIIASDKGIVKAMNNALSKAKGEIFVRIDDDVEIPPTWLQELIAPFKNPYIAGTTGPTFVPKERRVFRDSIRIAENPNWFLRWMFDNRTFAPAAIYNCGSVSYDSNYIERFDPKILSGDRLWWTMQADHLEGTNWAMRTQLIKDVGGFDESFDGVCEWFDTDVEQKIIKLGYGLIYNPKAYLYHMLEKGQHFEDRFDMFGRIDNWIRYHKRHSKFHYKKIIWLLMMFGYAVINHRRR